MQAIYYHVDAFTDRVFGGNPAGVYCGGADLPDSVLQKIAAENNLSETAFFSRNEDGSYALRWFTPTVEIDLCGHATLATAHVIWRHETGMPPVLDNKITFNTKSGRLTVTRDEKDLLTLDFPSRPAEAVEFPADVEEAFGVRPLACLKARDYLFEFEDEETVRKLKPDFARLATWKDGFGVIVTAPGLEVDFASRFFAPKAGVAEDPVTGSAHCTLIPFWAARLGKIVLRAQQVSARGGELFCELAGERVKIGGRAVTYVKGMVEI